MGRGIAMEDPVVTLLNTYTTNKLELEIESFAKGCSFCSIVHYCSKVLTDPLLL